MLNSSPRLFLPHKTRARLRQACGLLLLATAAGHAAAQQPSVAKAYEPGFSFLRNDMSYDVRSDGTYTFERSESIRLNNDQGVRQNSQIPLSYSTSLQELEVLEAYTTTKDGRRIDVSSDKILLQQSPQSAGAPMFDDAKVKTVVFPATEVGAVLTLRWRTTQRTPLFPGAFSMSQTFSRTSDIQSSKVTLRAPESLDLHTDAVGLEGGKVASDQPGIQMWRWTLNNAPAHAPEAGAVSTYDFSPHVSATTFADYGAAGKAYLERARPKAEVTPAIRKLADELTKGIEDRRTQAQALYQWVSKDVRYVAIFLGAGGVVPHEAETIAQIKYGDCKDHVTLLEALLAAKGIKSSPVLVNLGAVYALPKVAVTPGAFNHAITYLPEFDLFVDSTARIAPFGVLPLVERGKPALITDDGHGVAKVVTLPPSSVAHDTVRVDTELSIDAEGGMEGKSKVVATGLFELLNRQVAALMPKGTEPQVASRMLLLTGQSGTGTYVLGDTRDLSSAFSYSTQFTLANQIQQPGPGALTIPAGLGSFSSIRSTVDELAAQPRRDFPAVVASGRHEEITVLTLPEAIKVKTLPKPLSLESPVGHYESSYAQDGNTLTVRRVLEVNLPAPVADPDTYQKLRALGTTVSRDLRTQLFY
ncbi:DUF3857 domain-containing protein [Variovorax sp. EL159]|uniref:DUF3857 domain-containing protein n=1 Tax=Variovorax sp. EL159 TaxID=1566270 RepID=UPI00087FFCF2|nr:DUF3857 domain-containing protein [Variovorax sp. EL159]SCX38420.1 Transglutaminase-like superfamily protein [Variovorax sp. EL159]